MAIAGPLLSGPFRPGDLQLEEQPKFKQLASCYQTSREMALFIRPNELLNVFPLLTADVSVRVGTVNQGVHLFELWSF